MSKFKPLVFSIDNTSANIRLDRALSLHPDIKTRSRASKLIQNDLVLVNGASLKASHKTSIGEVININLPVKEDSPLEAFKMDIHTYFEDNDLIILEKPAGLVVHPSAGHESDTLVNALIADKKGLAMGFGENRPGIVHRLDKDTSGVLVVAKNDDAHRDLVSQFKDRTADRRYWALVYGNPKKESGTITSYLKRHPRDRKKFASERRQPGKRPTGKMATTHFKKLVSSESGISLIECKLETGRTHQIRVHMAEFHHPIVGDEVYGSKKWQSQLRGGDIKSLVSGLNRLGLHAFELGISHPKTGERLYFRSPWPQNLLPIIETAGFNKKHIYDE